MSEFVEESFVNEFGQKIEVGEEVLMAGSSWKRTTIRKGVFKGVRYDNVTRVHYLKDENGENIKEERTNTYNGAKYFINKCERRTSREVVAVVVKTNRGKQYKWVDGKYVKSDEDVYGTSILPLKRVYKFSTPLAELSGTSF